MPSNKPTKVESDLDARLEDSLQDVIQDASNLTEQTDTANQAFRFVDVPGGHWEGFRDQISADTTTNRAMMQFDMVADKVNRFLGEWGNNRMGVEYKPDDMKTSDDDAELLNGIYRADFRDSSGKLSLDNGVMELAKCGYGALELITFFENEEDPEDDSQRIGFSPIHNAFNHVVWDSAAKRIDKRDARRCTKLIPMPLEEFTAQYPDMDPTTAYQPSDRKQYNIESGPTEQIVYIARRYEIIKRKETMFIYNNFQTGNVESYNKEDHEKIKDELRASEIHEFVRERKILIKTVETSLFTGSDYLEKPRRIAGKFIPIIPLYAYRTFVDGVEYYYGLIWKNMDPQRLFNMLMNQIAENAAGTGGTIPIFLRDQIAAKDVADNWADKNNKPFLFVDPIMDETGKIIAQGPIGYDQPGALDQNSAQLLQQTMQFLQGGEIPQDVLDPKTSGKAINAIIKRINMNTAPIMENISDGIVLMGDVYQSMAAEVYTGHQMVRTVGLDGIDSMKMLGKLTMDEETGEFIEANTLDGKKFRAYADVGAQYETLREQTVDDVLSMMDRLGNTPAGQKYMPALLAVAIANTSGVGMEGLKELNRRDMILQGLIQPETDEEKALLQQAQQPEQGGQEQLIASLAQQAEAEARERDSKAADNISSAELKKAQTRKTLVDAAKVQAETEGEQVKTAKTLQEIRTEIKNTSNIVPFRAVG